MEIKIKNNDNKFKFYNEKGKDITHEVVKKLGFRNLILTDIMGGVIIVDILKDGYFQTEMKRDQIKKLLIGNGFEIA